MFQNALNAGTGTVGVLSAVKSDFQAVLATIIESTLKYSFNLVSLLKSFGSHLFSYAFSPPETLNMATSGVTCAGAPWPGAFVKKHPIE